MDKNYFKDEDKEKFIEFLNFIHAHATWGKKTDYSSDDQIKYFKLLSYMQQQILPKIEDNILEVKEVVIPNKEEKEDNE